LGDVNTITANGTSGSHVTIQSNSGGSNGFAIDAGPSPTMKYNLTYTDFVRFGSSSRDALKLSRNSGSAVVHTFDHVTFDASSGRVNTTTTLVSADGYNIVDSQFLQTGSNGGLRLVTSGTTTTTRSIVRTVFEGPVTLQTGGHTVTDNYFGNLITTTGGSAWASFARNMVRQSPSSGSVGGFAALSDLTNSYILADNQNGNPHILVPTGSGTYDGLIFEYTGPFVSDGGDCVYYGGAITITMQNSIVLPAPTDGVPSCDLFNANSGSTVHAYHNTFSFNGEGGMAIGDLSSSVNEYNHFQSNIGWAPNSNNCAAVTTQNCHKIFSKTHSGNPLLDVQNAVTPANAGYNYSWNANTGYSRATQFAGVSGKGYGTNTDAAVGTNDIDDSGGTGPNFVDSTRNLATWAVTRGSASGTYAGKVADALTYLKADPTLTYTSLIPYVRAGFAPRNPALHGTAHDGGDIGAVAFQPSGSLTPIVQ
jgi:hypothetical protein